MRRTPRAIAALFAAAWLTPASSAPAQQVTLLPPVAVVQPSPPTTLPTNILTLDQVIATVLTADPKLRVGYEEVNQAVADSVTASLKPNPIFATDGQLIPLTRPFTPEQQGGPPQFDAAITYPIDWFLFGKRKAAMASAGIGVQQNEATYYDLIRTRVRDASVGFVEILELKALREVAVQDVQNLERIEAMTRKALEAGFRTTVELNRIQLDVLKSQQLVRDADVQLANSKARLRAQLGRMDSDPGFDVLGNLNQPAVLPAMSVDQAIAIAETERPDINALRYRIAKAEADTLVEKRKAYPDVATKVGYTRQFQGSIGYRDADSFLVGIDIGLPLADRNQGNRAKAASVLAQSQWALNASLVNLRAEIEQALNEYAMAARSAQAVAQDQLKLAEQVRDAINKAHEAGGRPLLDVLDAQRNYRETYRIYITSRANLWRASIRLNAALGRRVS